MRYEAGPFAGIRFFRLAEGASCAVGAISRTAGGLAQWGGRTAGANHRIVGVIFRTAGSFLRSRGDRWAESSHCRSAFSYRRSDVFWRRGESAYSVLILPRMRANRCGSGALRPCGLRTPFRPSPSTQRHPSSAGRRRDRTPDWRASAPSGCGDSSSGSGRSRKSSRRGRSLRTAPVRWCGTRCTGPCRSPSGRRWRPWDSSRCSCGSGRSGNPRTGRRRCRLRRSGAARPAGHRCRGGA